MRFRTRWTAGTICRLSAHSFAIWVAVRPPGKEKELADLQERILQIISQPQLTNLATVTEEGKPWVRYVITIGADDMTLRCATFVTSRKVKQIGQNEEVHLSCGVTDPAGMGPYLQIQGRADLVTDEEERHAMWNEQLEPIFAGPDDPNYGILVIRAYRIEYWTPDVFEPEVWEA